MATDVTFSNTFMAYWFNNPYNYYAENVSTPGNYEGTRRIVPINTGWHILPLCLWKHFTTPKQWAEMVINYEAYTVKGFTCTVYNPVPMTQQLAIQGTTTFTAFNNTIYSLGTKDDLYETNWYNWNDPTGTAGFNNFSLAYKEGYYLDNPQSTTTKRTELPVFYWTVPNPDVPTSQTWAWTGTQKDSYSVWPFSVISGKRVMPDGVFWDPLTSPHDIMELRPGKNSMSWSWNVHPCDEGKWFNIDQMAKWFPHVHDNPYVSINRAGYLGSHPVVDQDDPTQISTPASYNVQNTQMDYTVPNLADVPIVPMTWWWQEMQKSIAQNSEGHNFLDQPAMHWAGTEYESYKYPPTQCFIKGLPLFDDNGSHITTTTQGCFQVTLNLACKKRRSKIYAPTWGPHPWRVTHAINSPRIGSYVRYRTAGARRTWTNIENHNNRPEIKATRYVPYNLSATYTTTSTRTNTNNSATYTMAANKQH